MARTPQDKSPKVAPVKAKAAAPKQRARSVHLVYDQAVRATLKGGQREEIVQLLDGAKRLQAKYGDLGGLISALEKAAGTAK